LFNLLQISIGEQSSLKAMSETLGVSYPNVRF
jgi:hypothetical protein